MALTWDPTYDWSTADSLINNPTFGPIYNVITNMNLMLTEASETNLDIPVHGETNYHYFLMSQALTEEFVNNFNFAAGDQITIAGLEAEIGASRPPLEINYPASAKWLWWMKEALDLIEAGTYVNPEGNLLAAIQERLDMLNDNGESVLTTVNIGDDYGQIIIDICIYFNRMDLEPAGGWDLFTNSTFRTVLPQFANQTDLETAVGYTMPNKVTAFNDWIDWCYDAIRYLSWYQTQYDDVVVYQKFGSSFSSISGAQTSWLAAPWVALSSGSPRVPIANRRTICYSFGSCEIYATKAVFQSTKGTTFSCKTEMYANTVRYDATDYWDGESNGWSSVPSDGNAYVLLIHETEINNDALVQSPLFGGESGVPPYANLTFNVEGTEGWIIGASFVEHCMHKYDVAGGFTHIY